MNKPKNKTEKQNIFLFNYRCVALKNNMKKELNEGNVLHTHLLIVNKARWRWCWYWCWLLWNTLIHWTTCVVHCLLFIKIEKPKPSFSHQSITKLFNKHLINNTIIISNKLLFIGSFTNSTTFYSNWPWKIEKS